MQQLSGRETNKLYQRLAGDLHINADLYHNPSYMMARTGAITCLISKFNIFSLTKARYLLPEESALVQGSTSWG